MLNLYHPVYVYICFERICYVFKFAPPPTHLPTFWDNFYEAWHIIVMWKYHIQKCFIPSWISFLYVSMSAWMNKFTWPKPHPKGNYYHTKCCSESIIMYVWEIFERRDHPIPIGRPNMKTVGLIIWLTIVIWNTGKSVVMDSGLCVLKGLLETRKRGVSGSALMKIFVIGLGGFIETLLRSNSGQNILVMWDVLVVN